MSFWTEKDKLSLFKSVKKIPNLPYYFHEAFGETLRQRLVNRCYFFRSFESFWLGATWTPFVSKVHSCLGLEAFLPIDTRASICGDITHLGLPCCLVNPKEPCWDLFYFSFISMISQEILCQTQNSLQMIWRCIGYSGILRKMRKSYRKIFLTWNLGAMTGNWNLTLIYAKWCAFLKRMITWALNIIYVVTSWKLYLKLRILEFTLLRTCHGVYKPTNAQIKQTMSPDS